MVPGTISHSLRPALLWMDSRSWREAEHAASSTHPAMAFSGGADSSDWLVLKAMWVARHEAERYRAPCPNGGAPCRCYSAWPPDLPGSRPPAEWAAPARRSPAPQPRPPSCPAPHRCCPSCSPHRPGPPPPAPSGNADALARYCAETQVGNERGGGICTEPSACWCCSSSATIVRPSGKPDPLRVAGIPRVPPLDLVRIPARRAWNVPQFETLEISRYCCWPGSQTSRS